MEGQPQGSAPPSDVSYSNLFQDVRSSMDCILIHEKEGGKRREREGRGAQERKMKQRERKRGNRDEGREVRSVLDCRKTFTEMGPSNQRYEIKITKITKNNIKIE